MKNLCKAALHKKSLPRAVKYLLLPSANMGFDGKWQESSFITVSAEWELEMEAERLEANSNCIGLLIIIFTPSSYE